MQTIQKRMLIPNYVEKFACIGASCEDTCCALWEITIDQDTYSKYQNLTNTPLKEQIDQNLIKKKNKTASFTMNGETGNCSMLCDGLCSIQATLGENYLSKTCSTYPRVLNESKERIEATAVLSCPEVTRLVLFSKDSMNLSSSNDMKTPNLRVHGQDTSKVSKIAYTIRNSVIDILNTKEFSLEHRLIIIGVMLDNLNQLMKTKKYDQINVFLKEFKDDVRNNSELRDYNAFPEDDKLKFQFLNNNLMDHYKEFIWNKRYNECISDYIKGIQIDGSTLNRSLRSYRVAQKEIYQEYINENRHVFENYIMNYVYQNFIVDILNGESLFNFYIKMIIDYSLIKLHLVGMASAAGEMNNDMVAKLVQSYTKNYKFSSKFLDAMLNDVLEQGFGSLGGMSLMIK